MKIPKLIVIFLIFLVFLFWSVFSTSWYEGSNLVVKGYAETGQADLEISWDSGAGFNTYESRRLHINAPRVDKTNEQSVRVWALDDKNPGSKSTTVAIAAILIDGVPFDLTTVKPRSLFWDRLNLHLHPDEAPFTFAADIKQHLRIVFATSFYYGKVAVEINGVRITYDLYRDNGRYDERPYDFYLLQPDRSFEGHIPLTRHKIDTLLVKNLQPMSSVHVGQLQVCDANSCTDLTTTTHPQTGEITTNFPNATYKRYFDPLRFTMRVIFALINTWLIITIWQAWTAEKNTNKQLFPTEIHLFLCLAGIFTFINGLVLATFWPGVMSIDSLFIWRASELPEIYLNAHPILNQLFYIYLRGFWNHPAVVPLTQILITASLSAYVFTRIWRVGVSLWVLLPLFALLTFSLPILLYNTALWKDIPYALLVTGWGTYFALHSVKDDKKNILPPRQWLYLLFAYVGIGFFRYNGLVYLAVIPVFFIICGFVNRRKSILAALFAVIFVSGLLWSMSQTKAIDGLTFLTTSLKQHSRFLQNTSISAELTKIGTGFFQVFDMEKENSVSDKWHYYLNDRYSWRYFQDTELADSYYYTERPNPLPKVRKLILMVYEKSFNSPWKYLAWNPMHMLAIILLILVLFPKFPATAKFSGFLLCGTLPLLFLDIHNWRYYYFLYFGLYFIFPLIAYDIRQKNRGNN